MTSWCRWWAVLLVGCGGTIPALEPSVRPVQSLDGGAVDAGQLAFVRPFGNVLVRDFATSSGGHLNDVWASFGVVDGCVRERVGDCVVTSCGDGAGFFAAGVSVGSLTVGGVTFIGSPSPLVLPSPPYRVASPRPRQLWDGGEPLSLSVADVRLEVAAPTPLSLTAPSCTATSCLGTISRQQPLLVTWTAGARGVPVVSVSLDRQVLIPPSPSYQLKHVGAVECTFPADSSRGRIPVEVLARLPPLSTDGGFDEARITVSRRSSASTAIDGGLVTFDAEWTALDDACTWD